MTPCTGLHELFDSTNASDHQQAAAICATCPVVDWCRTQVPPGHHFPEGTWAGLLYTGQGRTDVLACRECDEPFTVSQSGGAYCSGACRSKSREKQRARYERETGRQRNRAAVTRYRAKRKAVVVEIGRAS